MTDARQTTGLFWLPCTILFGGLLGGALLLLPLHARLICIGWGACAAGIFAARLVGRFFPNREQAVQRALVETMVRPVFPLVGCVAVAVSLPVDEARVFAASLLVFFLTMLTFDRLMFVVQLPQRATAKS